ncbi:hypothetical protein AKO1_014555 [Acrasis kona]|uniref:Uncharacterized protein n=1 Tax=Acrasis kona TaxID=1008807 RepID=A0AAW2Z157_9EUKA
MSIQISNLCSTPTGINESPQTTNRDSPPLFDHEHLSKIDKNDGWKVDYQAPLEGVKFKSIVEYKTRLEPLSQNLPSAMYAPIIYQMHVTLKVVPENPEAYKKVSQIEFMLANLRVMSGNEEVLKNGRPIVTGSLKVVLAKQKNSVQSNEFIFFGHNKIQFLDCSYHHNKQAFQLQWSFHISNQPTNPFLIVSSTSFKVYARKPNKKRSSADNNSTDEEAVASQQTSLGTKRKRDENERRYEMHFTKSGQQDEGAALVPMTGAVSSDQTSPTQSIPLKKRFKVESLEAEPENPVVAEDLNDDLVHQQKLMQLLDYVKNKKKICFAETAITKMMMVARELYGECSQISKV